MSGSVEDFDGLCGIHAPFWCYELQLRCHYELGHHGPCSWEKYREQFRIWGGSNADPKVVAEQGFINSVINHKK
jgi:hypothetical protein